MKVGSLVICPNGHESLFVECILPASEDIIYTVRSIQYVSGFIGILLEEIISPKGETIDEILYFIEFFKEIQPPMDLTELLEETKTQLA